MGQFDARRLETYRQLRHYGLELRRDDDARVAEVFQLVDDGLKGPLDGLFVGHCRRSENTRLYIHDFALKEEQCVRRQIYTVPDTMLEGIQDRSTDA